METDSCHFISIEIAANRKNDSFYGQKVPEK